MARIRVKVVPRSSRSVVVADGDSYRAYLHAAPTDGQANDELVSILAKHFGVPKSSIDIVRGIKSRIKEVEIRER